MLTRCDHDHHSHRWSPLDTPNQLDVPECVGKHALLRSSMHAQVRQLYVMLLCILTLTFNLHSNSYAFLITTERTYKQCNEG